MTPGDHGQRDAPSEGASAAEVLMVGRVAKAHGITGELAVDIHTDEPEARFVPGAVFNARLRDQSIRPLTVSTVRAHSGRLLIRFDEVPNRDIAETMRGARLLVRIDELPKSEDPDAFYDHELEGLTAVHVDGSEIGTVSEVARGPGGELLVVTRADGTETLIPFVRAIVPEVDVPGGRVVVDPPEGLLE